MRISRGARKLAEHSHMNQIIIIITIITLEETNIPILLTKDPKHEKQLTII